MPMSAALRHFLSQLNAAERVPRPEAEKWPALIARIAVPGQIAEIDEETYSYFLEVLPPKYQGGSLFAFAEGAEELRLFWQDRDNHFWVRQLTWDETKTFCRLAGMSFPYWY